MANIHPTAIVESQTVELAEDVTVGAYAILEGNIAIGPGTIIGPHCVIRGHTVIGKSCKIGPAAYVGLDPQHLGYDGSETSLVVGDNVIIRETASLHRASKSGIEHATRVGDRCFLMGQSHVAHDCAVENDVVLAQGVFLGGHVSVGSRAFLGGGCVVHQFCRIGRLAIVRGNEAVTKDILPFGAFLRDGLKGYNAVGCKRAGLGREAIHSIRSAFQSIHSNRTVPKAVEELGALRPRTAEIDEILSFIATSKRGIHSSLRFLAHDHEEAG
jgi:UDP-N-acetylglucosamine acyltransferase